MNDKEFIELLNLYVDREISAEDALRLEKMVATNPRRREIYDQYCRIQKACTMLSEETLEMPAAAPLANVMAFPTQTPWRFGPAVAGLAAAAACALVVVGLRNHDGVAAVPGVSRTVTASSAVDLAADSIAMKPVLFVRLPSDQAPRGAQLLADSGAQTPAAQLNWIGDIHMSPVASGDFLLNPKADLKAAVMTNPQATRDSQEQVEMTAFRFQR